MDLDSAAAIATIVGTIVSVVTTILAFLGKLRLRLPMQLSTVEARGLFVLGVFIVALPILAWGPRGGLMLALANLMVVPGLPSYFEKIAARPQGLDNVRDLIFGLVVLALAVVNFVALFYLVPDPS